MHFDWWTLALQTINFAILVWLLQRFLYKPVLRMVDARRAEIAKQYAEASAAEAKAKDEREAVAAERTGIAAEREAALRLAAAQAEGSAAARHERAEHDADVLLEAARKTLAKERDAALAEAKRAAVDLGAEFARRFLSEVPVKLRAEAWIERIEQHLSALPMPERKALVRQFADGKSLTVVTAASLPADIAEAWRARLKGPLGDGTTVAFEVNPDIIAGVDLHFPSAILRFSWQSALAALRSEMDGHADTR